MYSQQILESDLEVTLDLIPQRCTKAANWTTENMGQGVPKSTRSEWKGRAKDSDYGSHKGGKRKDSLECSMKVSQHDQGPPRASALDCSVAKCG